MELALELPALPDAWARAFREVDCRLELADAAGTELPVSVSPWTAGVLEVRIELPAGSCSPVLAVPVIPELGLELRPAGAISPIDVDTRTRTLRASWERGAAAELLARLIAGSGAAAVPPEALDVERLARDMERHGEGDPWRVDAGAIVRSLQASGWTDWSCPRLPSRRVLLPVTDLPAPPSDRGYVRDDPFAGACGLATGEDGLEALDLGEVPVGFHRLFAARPEAAQERWLDLSVTAAEAAWIARSRQE